MINLTDSLSACTASGILAYAKQIYQQMSGGTATNVEDLLNEHEAKFDNQAEINAMTVKMDNRHNLSLGVGVVAQRSSFGFGSDSTTIYLTGNNKSYTATLPYDQGDTSGNSLFGDIFRSIFRGGYLLDYDGAKVAQITNASYDSDTQVITLTLDTDLGELNDQLYSLENVSGSYNFNAGAFGNKGGHSTCLGYVNMNRGDYSSLVGTTNSNSEDYSSLIGCYNRNDGTMGTVIGTYNTNKGDNSTVIGNHINFGENCTGSAVGSNINIYKGQNTGLDSGVSTAFALGSGLTLSHPSIALGRNNKDYDISGDTQNFFTLGCGEGENPLNLLEQSKNGNLFIKGIGNFDGTNSQSASTKSLQDVLDEIESGLQSAIKLNEYDEVNITHPISEELTGSILCNLVKDDDKIIQDHSAWGSEFADYVRNNHLYIGTNFGNSGIGVLENDDFDGYERAEEIVNVTDSNDKSTIANCIKSPHGYWIIQTESELTASDNLYSSIGTYYQKRNFTPFRLEQNGSLYLLNVGGYNGDASTTHQSESLQDVLDEIASASASGGVTSWDDLEDKPTILDVYDVRDIVLEKCPLHYNDVHSNYISYIPNGSSDAYTTNTVRNTYNGIVLGKYNTTSGNTSYGMDNSTVIVGLSNTNYSRNSVLIGDTNNNKSEGGVNIGHYNQNNGGERNVMVGYKNYASNSASTLCMGSKNMLTWYSNNPANQEIIAIGRGLECNTGGIFLGYYNVDDNILTGDTANFLTIGNGSGTTYPSTRSNIIEQRRNGDIYIKGIGNYNGNNSRYSSDNPYRGKSLQEVLSGISDDVESSIEQTTNIQAKIAELENAKALLNELNTKMNVLMDDMDVEAKFAYGVQWDKTATSPDCTRVGNMLLHAMLPVQSQMRGCLLNDNGEVVKYLAESGWTEETLDGSMGQVMVEIPEFYWKFTESGNTQTVMLSQVPIEGYAKVSKRYVSAYEATIDNNGNTGTTNSSQYKLASVKNTTARYRGCGNVASNDETYKSGLGMPRTNLSLQTYRESARRRKPSTYEWNCYDYMTHKVLYWLFVVEFATRHTQKAVDSTTTISGYKTGGLGNGVTTVNNTEWTNYPIVPCGTSDSLGNGTGEVSYAVPSSGAGDTWTTVKVPRYRGIENPFGHIWKQTDGIKVEVEPGGTTSGESKVYVCYTPSNYNSTSNVANYNYIGNEERSQGNVKEIFFGPSGDLFTSVNGGDSNTYYGDYHYVKTDNTATEYRSVRFGGSATYGAYAGFVCAFSNYGLSNSATSYGSRLCFIPDAT